MYQCYQVRVQYIDQEYRNNTYVDEFQASDWKNLSRYDNLENEVKKTVLVGVFVYLLFSLFYFRPVQTLHY